MFNENPSTENAIRLTIPIGIAACAFSISAAFFGIVGEFLVLKKTTVSLMLAVVAFGSLGLCISYLIIYSKRRYDYFSEKNRFKHIILMVLIPVLIGFYLSYSSYKTLKAANSNEISGSK